MYAGRLKFGGSRPLPGICTVRQVDTMKRKRFTKEWKKSLRKAHQFLGIPYRHGKIVVGVVGVLQLDVLKFRLETGIQR